ncbi:MAG: glycosyltransferase family 39 protein, partial [Sphingomonas sp.]
MAIAAALIAGLIHRGVFGWYAPLWLDETYTGVIASQSSFAGLVEWCRHELSGPIFYGGMWLWTKVAGNGDVALRLPSLICSLGSVATIAAFGGNNRRERLVWAALAAVWLPGLMFAAQARPQALLFLLATVQAIAFWRCMTAFSSRLLMIWAAAGALMMLTHVYAVVITGLQCLCIVWTFRARWRDCWPVLIMAVIVAAWLPQQLSFMMDFMKPGVAWYPKLQFSDFWMLPLVLIGDSRASFVIVAAAIAILGAQLSRRWFAEKPMPYSRADGMLALSGLVSIIIVLVAGLVRPSFTPRYLIPYIPAALFGITCILCRSRFLWRALPSIILAALAGMAMQDAIGNANIEAQQRLYPLEFEHGSNWLMARGARRVTFLWDSKTGMLSGLDRQAEIGSFFFRRSGYVAAMRAAYIDHAQQSGS